MRQVFDGKVYDSDRATILAEKAVYSNGNYCGIDQLMITNRGLLFGYCSSTGQDLYRSERIRVFTKNEAKDWLHGWILDKGEVENLISQGIISEA